MKSQPGVASGGENVDPGELPDESAGTKSAPRAAPAPGVPMSEEEFERLKEVAKHAPAPRGENSPKDRPKKKGNE